MIVITAPATAQAFRAIGDGVAPCGAWTYVRQSGNDALADGYRQWVVGLLSGVGAVEVGKYNPLQGVDAQVVWSWTDRYCLANPSKLLTDAAVAFAEAHPNRDRRELRTSA